MPIRPEVQRQINALDELARRQGWEPGPLPHTWRVRGYGVAVGSTGIPRKYVASRGHSRIETFDLDELCRKLGVTVRR